MCIGPNSTPTTKKHRARRARGNFSIFQGSGGVPGVVWGRGGWVSEKVRDAKSYGQIFRDVRPIVFFLYEISYKFIWNFVWGILGDFTYMKSISCRSGVDLGHFLDRCVVMI